MKNEELRCGGLWSFSSMKNSTLNGRKQSRQHRNSKATSKQIAIVTTNVSRNNIQPKANQTKENHLLREWPILGIYRWLESQLNSTKPKQNKSVHTFLFCFCFFVLRCIYDLVVICVAVAGVCLSLSLFLAVCDVCVWHSNSEISIYIGLSHFNSVHSFVLYYK